VSTGGGTGRLLAISDLHVAYADNRELVKAMRAESEDDWLIVAGDVGELTPHIEWALRALRERFTTVIWVPGNHELSVHREDPVQLRGLRRYEHLIELCHRIGVLTPEDPYPVWHGAGGPATIVPMFLLYDYSFLPAGTTTKEQALARAHETGIVCSDEYLLHPDPYPTRDAWCAARLELTRKRLEDLEHPEWPTILVNHYPLVRQPTDVLYYPEFSQWCGTTATADWHLRFNAATVLYGHLHIPRVTWYDGVRFEEVSLGYPREWKARGAPPTCPRVVLAPQKPSVPQGSADVA
jgi:3',5'-cyclic AMP phosphodiesterase CpdA